MTERQQRVDDVWASADALGALAPHLPRYRVSLAAYAAQLAASA